MAKRLRTRILLTSAAVAIVASPAFAEVTRVASGTTDTDQQSVKDMDRLIVHSNAALVVDDDTAIKWNDASTNVRIVNFGVIESTATD